MKTASARRLLADFRRFAGSHLTILCLLMAGSALAEGFGIVLLVPLIAAATDAGGATGQIGSAMRMLTPPGLSGTAAALLLFLLLMIARAGRATSARNDGGRPTCRQSILTSTVQ